MPSALALDLGTSVIKAGRRRPDGALDDVRSAPAPPLRLAGLVAEGSAEEYFEAADGLLTGLAAQVPAHTPLGLAAQRSTFLVWDRESGRPLTPMISWQDRRAAAWCDRHAQLADSIAARTGLRLSPHYVGPKLAVLQEADPSLARKLKAGSAWAGTLDSYLLWKWTGGRVSEIDLTMAARTLLADPMGGDWADDLLNMFGVARSGLCAVSDTVNRRVVLANGLVLTASVADQAAAAWAILLDRTDSVLVNLGTGGFVMCPIGPDFKPRPGYLCGPILKDGGRILYAWEGTINGAGISADRFGVGPTPLPERDPAPDAFCLPDQAGVGAPHWRPELGFAMSPAAQKLRGANARRVVLEGIVFRVREILEDLERAGSVRRVVLSGGLTRDPFVAPALAACLGRPVEIREEAEATLLGAAGLAAGQWPSRREIGSTVTPGAAGSYLCDKHARWKKWLLGVLEE